MTKTAKLISSTGVPLRLADAETCGNCRFHTPVPQELRKVVCRGVPPTPIVLGGQQTVAGLQLQIENFYPQTESTTPACALYQRISAAQSLAETPAAGEG